MDSSVKDQVKAIVAALFGLPVDEVSNATSPDNVETWDSLQHLTLVLELERVFSVQMTPEEINELLSVGAIVEMMATKTKLGVGV